ncbi:HK97 gp10 family phage protein [Culicoidibacter larvae]|nr:HK97 gp10 family phage protein [Culicoidibacter larvae]
MGKYCDFSELTDHIEKLKLKADQIDRARELFLDHIVMLYIRRIKKRTNVDTGMLRKMWMAEKAQTVFNETYASVFNNMEYALFVNNGHRALDGSWVEGFFFVERTDDEMRQYMEKAAKKFYDNYFKDLEG